MLRLIYNLLYKGKYPEQATEMPKTAELYVDHADICPDKKR